MLESTTVEARVGYKIWLQYLDGTSGVVDLSDLAGRGAFRAWDAKGCFEGVHVPPHRAIEWNDEIELCPDALHLELTGDLD